ncbi:CotH kinase family protein, partial [Novipirellula sp.]|uniref:CotH kinase family protein n=1 Tax=Novipirellula sp. TaxID=2795430 RepID=UPI00356A076B
YIPTPKANFVHVVINGESWGLYVSVQQFDKLFLQENFGDSKGTRWKVSGNPGADGGLRYLGTDLDEYKSRFEMKSNDGKKAWKALIELCQTLNETPLDQLESALDPILDIDGVLKFLALDVALVNGDGYWTRASDYSIFLDADGKFHLVPHDMNEAFALSGHGRGPGGPGSRGPGGPDDQGNRGDRGPQDRGPGGFRPPPGFEDFLAGPEGPGGPPEREGRGRDGRRGPGGPGGPGHGGVDLDPLVGLDSERMPLRSRLLAVPELRERYMQYVAQIANESLDWSTLGPVVNGYRDLIAPVVKADTRKLDSTEAFVTATRSVAELAEDSTAPMSLQKFAVERSKFLKSKR